MDPEGDSLSPDASHFTTGTAVVARVGTATQLPDNYVPEGRLDQGTLIGFSSPDLNHPGNMATVSLGNPSAINDLGFKGHFVGAVQSR